MNELLTSRELEKYLKIVPLTLLRWVKAGMPHIKAGQGNRFEIEKVLQWLEEQNIGRKNK